MPPALIEIDGLRKEYGSLIALDLSELAIHENEAFGLVGNNGAGKTTLFSLVLDLIKASSGRVLSRGADVSRSEHWKSYTGAYLDEGFVLDFLTADEYFRFIASVYNLSEPDYEEFQECFREFFANQLTGNGKLIRDLSKGNQKKVGIAAALMAKPEIVVLDEPFPNLDPTSVSRLKKILNTRRGQSQTTFLISSHNLNHITDVCDRIVVLEAGKIVRDIHTSPDTLRELEAYFEV